MCAQERQWCVGWVGNLGVEDSGPMRSQMLSSLDQTRFMFLRTPVPFRALNVLSSRGSKQTKVPGMARITKNMKMLLDSANSEGSCVDRKRGEREKPQKVTWNLSTDDDKRDCEEFVFTPFDGHWRGPECVPVQWRHGESSLVNQGEKLEEEQGCGRQWSELGKGSVMPDSSVSNKLQTSPTFIPCYKELTEWQFGRLVNTQCAIYLHKEKSLQVIHRILTGTHFSHGKAEDQVIKHIRFQS